MSQRARQTSFSTLILFARLSDLVAIQPPGEVSFCESQSRRIDRAGREDRALVAEVAWHDAQLIDGDMSPENRSHLQLVMKLAIDQQPRRRIFWGQCFFLPS